MGTRTTAEEGALIKYGPIRNWATHHQERTLGAGAGAGIGTGWCLGGPSR